MRPGYTTQALFSEINSPVSRRDPLSFTASSTQLAAQLISKANRGYRPKTSGGGGNGVGGFSAAAKIAMTGRCRPSNRVQQS